MSTLLERLNSLLERPAAAPAVPPAEPAHRAAQDVLSGALGEKIVVRPWVDGTPAAVVPSKVFIPNGLRVVESAVPGHPAVLAGTPHAVANAERRLAKLLGEGHGCRLVDFDPATGDAVFTILSVRADA